MDQKTAEEFFEQSLFFAKIKAAEEVAQLDPLYRVKKSQELESKVKLPAMKAYDPRPMLNFLYLEDKKEPWPKILVVELE